MKFRTKYSEKNERSSNPGSEIKVEYQLVYDDKGIEHLEPCGQTNVKEMIQSYRDSVDIDQILARYANGNYDVLDQAKGFYADVTELPVKLSDVMNLNLKGKEFFDGLPTEYKNLYGDDYMRFINSPEVLVDYLSNKEAAEAVQDVKEVTDDNKEQ